MASAPFGRHDRSITEVDIEAGLRRARVISWIAPALLIGVLLLEGLGAGLETRTSRILLYGGFGLFCVLSGYAASRGRSLRREQRRRHQAADQEAYRRLVTKQRMN